MPIDPVNRDELRSAALNTSFADAVAIGGPLALLAWPLGWVAARVSTSPTRRRRAIVQRANHLTTR